MDNYRCDYSEWVQVNGDRQNIRVRSQDESNPVILFVHGGPGVCDRHWVLKEQSGLSSDFTLVMWDQRGSGKSYTKSSCQRELHVSDYVDDVQTMAEYLCKKFGQEKIILACHSWGTVIGLPVAARAPERIAAYIGQGQFVNGAKNEWLSYQFCLEEARRLGDRGAVRKLEDIAPKEGKYPSHKAMMTQRDYLTRYGGADYRHRGGMVSSLLIPLLRSSEYSLGDMVRYAKGGLRLTDILWGEVVACNFDETIPTLQTPVLLTIGRHDYNTPFSLSRAWFDSLQAPRKEWAWFEDSAHSPIKEEPLRWGEVVREFCLSVL